MADIVLPNAYRAQVILHGASGLPTDRYVNSWCFQEQSASPIFDHEGAHQLIRDRLTNFYTVPAGASPAPNAYLSGEIASAELRTYDLSVPPPREPLTTAALAWTFPNTAAVLPEEVAVVASFRGTLNHARARGRIYLGPLGVNAVEQHATGPRPTTNLRTGMVDQMQALHDAQPPGSGLVWVILSNTAQVAYSVQGGWVDDAFDTQRSRGREPLLRHTWGISGQQSVA